MSIDKLAMCASTVSSKMLQAMAKQEGFTFRETLTGFKLVSSLLLQLPIYYLPVIVDTLVTKHSSWRRRVSLSLLLTKRRLDL